MRSDLCYIFNSNRLCVSLLFCPHIDSEHMIPAEKVTKALASGREYLGPLVDKVSEFSGISRVESELLLLSVVGTALVTVLTLLLVQTIVSPRSSKQPQEDLCCATKFAQQRKAQTVGPSIPASSGGGACQSHSQSVDHMMHEIQHQLIAIHREILALKQEREVIDNELIETSTQILQTIGAQLNSVEEYEQEALVEPHVVMKPVPSRIQVPQKLDSPRTVVLRSPVVQPAPASQPQIRQPQAPQVAPVKPVSAPIQPPVQVPVQPSPERQRDASPSSHSSRHPVVSIVSPVQRETVPVVQATRDVSPASHPVMRPQIQPPAAQRTQSPLPQPTVKASVAPFEVQAHTSPAGRAPVQPPPPLEPVQSSSPAVKPAAPPAFVTLPSMGGPAKAAPKMSALAAARLKREQEMADAKAAPVDGAPSAATNPFGKPKQGPFGAVPLGK